MIEYAPFMTIGEKRNSWAKPSLMSEENKHLNCNIGIGIMQIMILGRMLIKLLAAMEKVIILIRLFQDYWKPLELVQSRHCIMYQVLTNHFQEDFLDNKRRENEKHS